MRKLLEAIRKALAPSEFERLDRRALRDIGVESWHGEEVESESARQRRLLRLAATRIGVF